LLADRDLPDLYRKDTLAAAELDHVTGFYFLAGFCRKPVNLYPSSVAKLLGQRTAQNETACF
jgi:hypothetical protein